MRGSSQKMSCVPLPWWTSKSTIATRSSPWSTRRVRAATATLLNRQKPIACVGVGVVAGRAHGAEGAPSPRRRRRRRPRRRRHPPRAAPPRPRRGRRPCRRRAARSRRTARPGGCGSGRARDGRAGFCSRLASGASRRSRPGIAAFSTASRTVRSRTGASGWPGPGSWAMPAGWVKKRSVTSLPSRVAPRGRAPATARRPYGPAGTG